MLNFIDPPKFDYSHRITPDLIKTLPAGFIFVFGSNTSGRHGKGAAKTALGWGAKWNQGEGLQGRTYGIPTKGTDMRVSLTLEQIKPYVDRFIEFAVANPDLTFLVTLVGCGLAGYKPKHIAPLFKEAVTVENIHLPKEFWHKLIR